MIVSEFGDTAGPALAPPRRVRAAGPGPAPALGLARAKRTLDDVAAELFQCRFGVRLSALHSARNPSARFTGLARKLHVDSPDPLASELQTTRSAGASGALSAVSHGRMVAQLRRSLMTMFSVWSDSDERPSEEGL